MQREKRKKGRAEKFKKRVKGEEGKRGKGKKRLDASSSSTAPSPVSSSSTASSTAVSSSTASSSSVSGSQRNQTTVSVIGAGRLGTALARALASRGYAVEAVVARRLSHAQRAARLISTQTLALSAKQLEKLPQSRLILITTPDDMIAEAAARLAATRPKLRQQSSHQNQQPSRPTRIALHASGALSSEILSPLSRANFRTGSLHPLISVSDPTSGAESLREAFFCIEGEAQAVRVARRIVSALGARSFAIKERDKALYHAAAVMASGHVTALFDIATEMLKACGLTKEKARAVLLPLTRSALENLSKREPARALTGTFARADIATVRKHLAALKSSALRDALAAYILLGQRSLKLAKESGADVELLKAIAETLRDEK